MHDPIHHGPTVGAQALRALARYPDRIAFVEGDRRTTYAATLDLVARIQAVYAAQGLGRGDRIAILTANRSEAWCASVAAQASAMSITWLHPLGSLDDQAEQIVDGECSALLVDDANFLARGAEIAARAKDALRAVFSLGRTDYSIDLIAAGASVGAANARDIARPDDVAILNYTGGTTGKSKGALRNHAQNASYTTAILSDFEIPIAPRYLVIAPMSHVAGTKILPCLMLGGTIHLMKGFDPQAGLDTIAR